MFNVMILGLIVFLVGAFFLQGLRKIPAIPPHKGLPTRWGKKVEKEPYKEGWGFYPGFPQFIGFIPINVETVATTVPCEKVRTPDLAESKVPVELALRPDPDNLIKYIDNSQMKGVLKQLGGEIQERVREWAMGKEEGPANWVELNASHLEATAILLRKIVGMGEEIKNLPDSAQCVPTWIWLRYFTEPRPTKFFKNEEPWSGKEEDGGDWERVTKILRQIEADHGELEVTRLREAVEARKIIIRKLRNGEGLVKLRGLGVILTRLNIGDINALGKVGELAESQAKEEQERRAEETETTNLMARMKQLMTEPGSGGPGLTREQALEQIQLVQGKASKTIDAKTITLDPVTATLVAKILERK
jgi:hypothetical protein